MSAAHTSALARLARACAVFIAFTVVDPFGLASSTSRASEEFIYRVISLFQPEDGATSTAVVLIDDRSAREVNGDAGYPITFRQHAAALRPVMCSGPAALFIDLTFRGVRSDVGSVPDADMTAPIAPLVDVLALRPSADDKYCRLPDPKRFHASASPRVFTARIESHPPDPCDPLFGRPLAEACRVGRVVDRLAEVAKPVTVPEVKPDGSYLLAAPKDNRAGPLEASPALAMVLAFCEDARGTPRQNLRGCRDREALAALLAAGGSDESLTLHPLWSFYKTEAFIADKAAHSADEAKQDAACSLAQLDRRQRQVGRLSIIASEFWRTLLPFEWDGAQAFGKGLCTPADAFSIIDVRQMATYCGSDPDSCQRRMASFFAGRMVFYGADITGINDLIETPVVGLVPGAAFHATVAENLINLGADYRRSPREYIALGGLSFSFSDIADIVIFVLVGLVLTWVSSGLAPQAYGSSRQPHRWLALAFFVVLSVGIAVSLYLAAKVAVSPAAAVTGSVLTIVLLLSSATVLVGGFGPPWCAASLRWIGRRVIPMTLGFVFVSLAAWALYHALHFPPSNLLATVLLLAQLPLDD